MMMLKCEDSKFIITLQKVCGDNAPKEPRVYNWETRFNEGLLKGVDSAFGLAIWYWLRSSRLTLVCVGLSAGSGSWQCVSADAAGDGLTGWMMWENWLTQPQPLKAFGDYTIKWVLALCLFVSFLSVTLYKYKWISENLKTGQEHVKGKAASDRLSITSYNVKSNVVGALVEEDRQLTVETGANPINTSLVSSNTLHWLKN